MRGQRRPPLIRTIAVSAVELAILVAALLHSRRGSFTLEPGERWPGRKGGRWRHVARRLIEAQDILRARIAGELHNDVSQHLAGVSVALGTLRRSLADPQGPTSALITEVQNRMFVAIDSVRRLSGGIYPGNLDLLGLPLALQAHCTEVARRFGVRVSCTAPAAVARVPPALAMCVFRIAEEALCNAVLNGGAHSIDVTLSTSVSGMKLQVVDDGRGFGCSAARRGEMQMGLCIVEERAMMVGGSVRVTRRPEGGTFFQLTVPIECPSEGAA